MVDKKPEISCISCAIFQNELRVLQEQGELDLPIRFLPSMLHMKPEMLAEKLDATLKKERQQGGKVLLLYGDCHPDMHRQQALPGVARIAGINCPEIMLGSEAYRRLRKEGVFFLMPEWTLRWREVFQEELGLTAEVARDFMGELHSRLLYLDTGVFPVPKTELQDVAEYTGLPWEVMVVDPGHLRNTLLHKIKELNDAS